MKYLLFFAFLLTPASLPAAAPPLDPWLHQHPDISGKIVWDFPDVLPDLPADTTVRTVPPWILGGRSGSGANDGGCAGTSCPQYVDFSPGPGKTMQWYYWPESYKARLRDYFQQYYTWMEGAWPLYQQYQAGGYSQKQAGFDERFASHTDPSTGAPPSLLPFAATVMKDMYTHVLYEPGPAFDLYLKTLALQLVLEIGSFVDWKLSGYRSQDLSVILDGRYLFQYFPAGSKPWGGTQTVDAEGYVIESIYPAPPLVAMKFLMREGILRNSRWETLSQWLEWERSHLQHTLGNPQSLTGECGKEYHEVYWGTKGAHPAHALLHGTAMACPLVAIPGSGSTQSTTFSPEIKHYTGGCGSTGALNHRMMRQVNLAAERIAFTHGQSRFVVEQDSLQQMLDTVGPQLPAEPAIDDGVMVLATNVSAFSLATTKLQSTSTSAIPTRSATSVLAANFGPGAGLANAYIDHNDNPYGMIKLPEALVAEALLDEATYQRWFPEVPSYLSGEARSQFVSAHNNRVSLRPTQLRIARIPLHTLQYFCWKEDAGKPRGETETYGQFFEGKYTVEELEATGFWTRFEQKLADLGGCEALPPMW